MTASNKVSRPLSIATFSWLAVLLAAIAGWSPLPAHANARLTQFTVDPGPSPAPAKVWPVAAKASLIPIGSELCGIDSIFVNGFESTVPPLTSYPGSLVSPGVSQSIAGPPTFSITITDPPNSASVPGSTTPVVGTFSGPTNTGIVVNGQIAQVSGNQFLVPSVAIAGTSTPIMATATKMTGETTTFSIGATGGATAPPVALTIALSAGFTPFSANFAYSVGSLPNSGTVTYVGIDANADGTDDIVNPTASTPLVYIQKNAGLYHAKLTLKDNHNVTYTAYVYYIVRATNEINGMLCDVYGYMKQQLTAPGGPFITNALNAIHPNAQSEFQSVFSAAGSGLPSYVGNLGSIVSGTLGTTFVSYLVVRQNPDLTLSGYHMEFTQDAAGVWRIGDM